MSKKLLYALLIIAASVIVLLLNTGSRVAVSLHFAELSAMKSLVFLVFIVIGVVVGVLLK